MHTMSMIRFSHKKRVFECVCCNREVLGGEEAELALKALDEGECTDRLWCAYEEHYAGCALLRSAIDKIEAEEIRSRFALDDPTTVN